MGTQATARVAHSAEDWRRHAVFMAKPSNEPSRTERARVALACAWMQLLKLRKTATWHGIGIAQLDEEPVRVGVRLLRAVELFHALGGLLEAQAHATQELSDPSIAGMDVVSLCVEPVAHQASDRHRTGAHDVAGCGRSAVSCLRVTAKSSCRAVLLLVRSVSSGGECSG